MNGRRESAWSRRRRRDATDRDLIERLAMALASSDRAGVLATLHPHLILTIDSGGLLPNVLTPVVGATAAAAALGALVSDGISVVMASINGAPGFILRRDETVVGAVSAETRAGSLRSLWVVCNPEKLRHWNG